MFILNTTGFVSKVKFFPKKFYLLCFEVYFLALFQLFFSQHFIFSKTFILLANQGFSASVFFRQ